MIWLFPRRKHGQLAYTGDSALILRDYGRWGLADVGRSDDYSPGTTIGVATAELNSKRSQGISLTALKQGVSVSFGSMFVLFCNYIKRV